MIIKERPLRLTVLALVYLPIFIFLMGWCRPYIAIPGSIALLYALYRYIRQVIIAPPEQDDTTIKMHPLVFVVITILVIYLCLISGYGHLGAQHPDWIKHNAILHDLVQKKWPVLYQLDGETRMLSYYIGTYLVPAVTGKLFHSCMVAEVVLGIYTGTLFFITYLLLLCHLNLKKGWQQICCLVLLIFFSGLHRPAHKINALMGCRGGGGTFLADLPNIYTLCFRPFPEILRAYIQGIPAIASLLLILKDGVNIRHIGLLLLPQLIFSPFTFTGLFLLVMSVMFIRIIDSGCISKAFCDKVKDLVSLHNIISIILGAILIIYFLGNILLEKPNDVGIHIIKIKTARNLIVYLSFCLFMFGLYYACLWKNYHKNTLFVANFISLCFVPLITMGIFNDWCQGVSIPLMFTLFLFASQGLFNNRLCVKRNIALGLIILVGAIEPGKEVYESIHSIQSTNTIRSNYHTDGLIDHFNDEDPAHRLSYRYNYMSGPIDKDLFYKYIAKR